jgi:hypothetical protein
LPASARTRSPAVALRFKNLASSCPSIIPTCKLTGSRPASSGL